LRDTAGQPAHAATFIRQRLVLLDRDLLRDPAERRRIRLHEFFHFVWVRLGNPRRRAWEAFLAAEWKARARGEAGWSAEWRKRRLTASAVSNRSRFWREYCCESFCDTAAWIFRGSGHAGGDSEVTLSPARRRARAAWFRANLPAPPFPI
jgi:hypothetical protein